MPFTPLVDSYQLPTGTTSSRGGRGAPPVAPPVFPPTGFTTSTVLASASSAPTPFSFGQAFNQGHVPSGSRLTGLQLDVKTTWADGSAQWGIVSGVAPANVSQPVSVGMALGSGASGAAILPTALQTQALVVVIAASGYGSATWADTDWLTPAKTWISGPTCSHWVYRKPIGSDAHLVACLEVRAWSTGDVDVLPYVENGYLNVAAPGARSATYSCTINGAVRFSADINLLNHTRTPLVDGTLLSHWVGTSRAFKVKHDAAYLMASELVPTYKATTAPTSNLVLAGPATFTPLQQGRFEAYMPGTGYSPEIMLIPQWDVLHLTTTATETWDIVQRQGYSAGRYGIHYRDETTKAPLAFATWPRLQMSEGSGLDAVAGAGTGATLTPSPTGAAPPTWNVQHHPSIGYFAALITGRPYHVETIQFAAAAHYLKNNSDTRVQANGVMQSGAGANSLRGAAWAIRTLAQAAMITPDDSPLKDQYLNSLGANAAWYHAMYVAQANNPLGLVYNGDYTTTDTIQSNATWQHDYFVASWGYALAMRLGVSPTNLTKAQQLFDHICLGVVGRLGDPADMTARPFYDAATYETAVAPSPTADWGTGTGPWYANWREAYVASGTYLGTDVSANPTQVLRGGNWPSGTGFWGNLHPAIAYAVRHGAPGADAAWARMTNASNYGSLSWVDGPEQSIIPATQKPSWLTSKSVNEWFTVANTTLTASPAFEPVPSAGYWGDRDMFVRAENGAGLDEDKSELWMFGGGHSNWAGNELLSIRLDAENPAWQLRCPRSTLENIKPYGSSGVDWTVNLDGKPASRHSYQGTHFIRKLNRYMAFDGFTWYQASGRPVTPSTFNPVTGTWDAATLWNAPTPFPYNAGPGGFAKHPITEDMYWMPGNGYSLWKLDTVTKVWSQITGDIGSGVARMPTTECGTIDSVRNAFTFLTTRGGTAANQPRCTQINLTTGVRTEITINDSPAWTAFKAQYSDHAALHYVVKGDYFLYYFGGTGTGGRIWKLTPNNTTNWDLTELTMTGVTVPDAQGVALGNVLTRFRFLPALNAVAVLLSTTQPIYMARLG